VESRDGVGGVAEQRLQAVLEVMNQGRTATEVAARYKEARQTVDRWLLRYETYGLEGLGDRSHRPKRCPHQMPANLEAAVVASRRVHPHWDSRRLG
jgi:transposase